MTNEQLQEKLAEIVEEVAADVIANETLVSHAVRNGALSKIRGRVRTELACIGLGSLVNDRLSKMRHGGGWVAERDGIERRPDPSVRRTANPGHPHPRDEIRFITVACGNGLFPLDEVPVDDLAALAADAEGKARAWGSRAKALRLAEQACRDAGVERLRDLDDEDTYAEILRTWRGE